MNKNIVGAIVVNGYYKSSAYTHQVNRLSEELLLRGVKVATYYNNQPTLTNGSINLDFAIFLDKDTNLAKIMENSGVKVFNSSDAIANADSKIKTAILLEKYHIKMPLTVAAPMQYNYILDKNYLKSVAKKLGYPLVIKTAQGSLGTQVFLANDWQELINIDTNIGNKEKLYQQFIAKNSGKSYRVIVIGQKVVASMLIENNSDFRSNVNLGGISSKVELDNNYKTLAEKTANCLDLDYCGIDFFVDKHMVLEVNSNAFFESAEKVTKVNIAGAYIDYILNKMGEKLNECT